MSLPAAGVSRAAPGRRCRPRLGETAQPLSLLASSDEILKIALRTHKKNHRLREIVRERGSRGCSHASARRPEKREGRRFRAAPSLRADSARLDLADLGGMQALRTPRHVELHIVAIGEGPETIALDR